MTPVLVELEEPSSLPLLECMFSLLFRSFEKLMYVSFITIQTFFSMTHLSN